MELYCVFAEHRPRITMNNNNDKSSLKSRILYLVHFKQCDWKKDKNHKYNKLNKTCQALIHILVLHFVLKTQWFFLLWPFLLSDGSIWTALWYCPSLNLSVRSEVTSCDAFPHIFVNPVIKLEINTLQSGFFVVVEYTWGKSCYHLLMQPLAG